MLNIIIYKLKENQWDKIIRFIHLYNCCPLENFEIVANYLRIQAKEYSGRKCFESLYEWDEDEFIFSSICL